MQSISISSDFAGGNIHVVSVDGSLVKVEQELRDSSGWWFYWNFRAKARQAQKIAFEFMNGEVIGPWGPAVSKDGVVWDWLGADSVTSAHTFEYRFGEGEQVYFSFSLPYQVHHFEQFYARIAARQEVARNVFTLSEQLRPVPLLLIGNRTASKHIIFTGRHHSCESTPGYLWEGVLDYFLQQPNCSVLNEYLIHWIPFVDLDGVENGDQGKNRMPYDHNRDYTDAPIYRSTQAIADYVKSYPFTVGIDFHCPYKWGGRNDHPFIVKRGSPIKEENERFGSLLAAATSHRAASGHIVYSPNHDLDFGKEWNTSRSTCSSLFESRQMKLVCSFEFPYFGMDGMVFTQQSCRLFGSDFARALDSYL